MSLSAKTLFSTGASRGIGREIALKAAADGAKPAEAAPAEAAPATETPATEAPADDAPAAKSEGEKE